VVVSEVLAIDPGPERSAWLRLDACGVPMAMEIADNGVVVCGLADTPDLPPLAIEMVASYGMSVGEDVFETCVWIGRFIEAYQGPAHYVYRKDVKMSICGSMRATDSNIRQALIDRYGPGKEKAVGTKNAPGPLHGIKTHLWSALAAGVTWQRQQREAA